MTYATWRQTVVVAAATTSNPFLDHGGHAMSACHHWQTMRLQKHRPTIADQRQLSSSTRVDTHARRSIRELHPPPSIDRPRIAIGKEGTRQEIEIYLPPLFIQRARMTQVKYYFLCVIERDYKFLLSGSDTGFYERGFCPPIRFYFISFHYRGRNSFSPFLSSVRLLNFT